MRTPINHEKLTARLKSSSPDPLDQVFPESTPLSQYHFMTAIANKKNSSPLSGTSEAIGSEAQDSRYGISGILCSDLPTASELAETDRLNATLVKNNVIEKEDEKNARVEALKQIEIQLEIFVKQVFLKLNLTEEEAREAGCKLYAFGSYSLGAHFAGADTDVLCLVPEQVTKQDFFVDFYAILKNLSEVKSLTAVAHAYVPVLKLKYNGIQLDLVFACVSLPKIGDDFDLENYEVLSKLEDTVLRSLNGPRVSRDIINLVPSLPVLQTALRFIKLWAKRRGLYSNVMGYFGGVAWALMVARICQLYPYATASTIVFKFFDYFSKWTWPFPVILKAIDTAESKVPAWNPVVSQTDQGHRMPIITPAFPSMCATHNVTKMNQAIITQELVRASELCKKIVCGEKDWGILLRDPKFFRSYKHFLQILACCEDESDQHEWVGNVESKLRAFVVSLEQIDGIVLLHTSPFNFTSLHFCQDDAQVQQVKDGDLSVGLQDAPSSSATKSVFATGFYIGILPEETSEGPFHSPELDPFILEFEGRLKKAGEVFPATASIKVLSIIKENLPPNVFIPPSYC